VVSPPLKNERVQEELTVKEKNISFQPAMYIAGFFDILNPEQRFIRRE